MAIISLSGYAGSGKDEVAKIIQKYDRKWEIKKFSAKLKQIASILTGVPEENFENQEFKKKMIGIEWMKTGIDLNTNTGWAKPMFVRDFLQYLGTEAIRNGLHENAWVNALFADYKAPKISEWKPSNWIITDCRFPNEYEAVKQKGGITIRINREGVKAINSHPSETALDNYLFDYTIENNGSLEDLENHIKQHILPHL